VVSWNVLAQVYTRSAWFPWSPADALKWKTRSLALLRDVKALDADVLLLQEAEDFLGFWQPRLEDLGYTALYKQRTGTKKDGCVLAFRSSRFALLSETPVEHNDLAAAYPAPSGPLARADGAEEVSDPHTRLLRDSVGLVALLQERESGRKLLAATTHVYWDPRLADVKDKQVANLLARVAQARAESGEAVPVLVCGDFNSTPSSDAVKLLFNVGGACPGLPPLMSVYGDYEAGEVTNHTPGFSDSIDYVVQADLRVERVLALPRRAMLGEGLPDKLRPSDHLPLAADLSFV
jgi:CCR4-NOT transcription complex subunit 6